MSKKYYFIILILLFSIGILYFLTLKSDLKTEKVDDREMIIKIDSLSARVKKLEEILSSKHENQQDSNEKLVLKDDIENDKILEALDTTKSQKEKVGNEIAEKKKAEEKQKKQTGKEKDKEKAEKKKSIKPEQAKKKKHLMEDLDK